LAGKIENYAMVFERWRMLPPATLDTSGSLTKRVFAECPWGKEKHAEVFCYECHELLLYNPVLLPEDVKRFSALVVR
jgi:hypothetical protein